MTLFHILKLLLLTKIDPKVDYERRGYRGWAVMYGSGDDRVIWYHHFRTTAKSHLIVHKYLHGGYAVGPFRSRSLNSVTALYKPNGLHSK